MTKSDRKASIEELALAYAIAYDWVKEAEQEVRLATADMGGYKINENGDFEWVRKFVCLKGTEKREAADFLSDGLTPVTDPEHLAIISRWKRALNDRKTARITFGRVKKSILALGRRELMRKAMSSETHIPTSLRFIADYGQLSMKHQSILREAADRIEMLAENVVLSEPWYR